MKHEVRKRLREMIGKTVAITQAEAARITDKDKATVNRWVKGEVGSVPDIEALYLLCEATGFSADYILGLSDIKRRYIEDLDKYDLVLCIKSVSEFSQHRDVILRAGKSIRVGCSDGKGGE
jgi:transcriptional regulator with XRE-family HTH domain